MKTLSLLRRAIGYVMRPDTQLIDATNAEWDARNDPTLRNIATRLDLTPQQVASGLRDYALHNPISLRDALIRAVHGYADVIDWIRNYAASANGNGGTH